MNPETVKVKSRLSALASSFDDLEELLEPLLAQPLPETIMGLEPLQQAKLQTILPYLVYDLVFIYLKTRGIDPKSHPVISELDRVRQYFEKIANAEKAEDKPATKLDKDAAERFIKHAIAQASKELVQNDPPPSNSTAPTVPVPVKITSKMLARAQYEQELQEQAMLSSESEELDIIDGTGEPSPRKSGETRNATIGRNDMQRNVKRKRPTIGYGESLPGSIHPDEPSYSGRARDTKIGTSIAPSTPPTTNEMSPSRSSSPKPQGSKKKKTKR